MLILKYMKMFIYIDLLRNYTLNDLTKMANRFEKKMTDNVFIEANLFVSKCLLPTNMYICLNLLKIPHGAKATPDGFPK